ncbi:MAG: long-chain fatty acid--CoA ligase [Alphaproteobacteria bacterium]
MTPVSYPWLTKYPPDVDWAAALEPMPVTRLLDDAAAKYGARPCLDFLDKKYSYAEVAKLVDRAAAGLQKLGVEKGARVGLFLPNTPYYVIMYFAVLKIGGVVVNFNPLYADREIEKQINDSGCAVMVTLDLDIMYGKLAKMFDRTCLKRIVVCRMAGILPLLKALLFPIVKCKEVADVPRDERHVPFHQLIANNGHPAPVAIDPRRDLAVLQYTGGTTGIPKGAALTHANLTINTRQSCLWFPGFRLGEEKMLAVLPFFHVFALTAVLNVGIAIGAEIIMLPRFELQQAVKTIHRKRPTLFPAVPTIYTAINRLKGLGKYNLSSIRFCISGGAGLPVEVKREFEKLTGCILVEGYGLSETSPVATANPIAGENKEGSIGLPLPGTIVEIVSLEDRKTVLPVGERGELCIRGPQVMAYYWHNEEETALVMEQTPDGPRLHTGDVGYMDDEGYTYIVDRIKDMISCSGFKVYPRHVEEAIYQHDCVEECIVAGIPDAYRGQTVKAYIKLREGRSLTRDDLLDFLKDKISAIEMPKHVEFRDKPLPKTLIGKLSRKLLLEEEAAKQA